MRLAYTGITSFLNANIKGMTSLEENYIPNSYNGDWMRYTSEGIQIISYRL